MIAPGCRHCRGFEQAVENGRALDSAIGNDKTNMCGRMFRSQVYEIAWRQLMLNIQLLRCFALLAVVFLNSLGVAQSTRVMKTLTHNEWRITVVRNAADVQGLFFS